MRVRHGLLIMLLAGCAAAPHATEIIVPIPGRPPVTVRVVDSGSCQLEDISLTNEGGEWMVAGTLRYRGAYLLTRSQRTNQLSAVDAGGETVFSCFVIARLVPATTRYKASRHGTFQVPIPAPDTFDHLELALGSAPHE